MLSPEEGMDRAEATINLLTRWRFHGKMEKVFGSEDNGPSLSGFSIDHVDNRR